MFCRDGLEYYGRICEANIRAALDEVETNRALLGSAQPRTDSGKILQTELDLASRMAAQSCQIMLWQQALAAGNKSTAKRMAGRNISALRQLRSDFDIYWPRRNTGTTAKCSVFLDWRIDDYQRNRLHFVRSGPSG